MAATQRPFSATEWAALKRCERTIHKWSEDLCNGVIQETEDGIFCRFYADQWGSPTVQGPRITDKSEKAANRAQAIARAHGLSVYAQSDPRGCGLHVFNAADLAGRDIDCCYSTIGRPVC